MKGDLVTCLSCDAADFTAKLTPVLQQFRGKSYRVMMPVRTCTMCGAVNITSKEADELRRLTADAYRQDRGLLTSSEIRWLRRQMGKSQREFAQFLGVGIASVKRWETWLVQDKSNDELMRVKCCDHLPRH